MPHTERSFLLEKLNQAKYKIEIGAKYKHTKTGGQYIIKDLAIKEDDESIQVVYEEISHPEHIVWSRCLDGPDGWTTPTEINGELVPRFTKITK